MKQDVVYILECIDGTLYTGWTNDLDARMQAHFTKRGAKYTRSHPPKSLVYVEILPDKQTALRREAQIKRLSRAKKRSLIETYRANIDKLYGSGYDKREY